MDRDYTPIKIENAKIFKTNFSGKEVPPYNPAGRRNFLVYIDDLDVAKAMEEDGWNIRWLEPRNPEDERKAFMSVAVSFSNRPPKIVLVTSKGMTKLDEETVDMLDYAERTRVDLTINPRYWEDNGKTRIKAYLRAMRVEIFEDELEKEIDDMYTNAPAGALDAVTDDSI